MTNNTNKLLVVDLDFTLVNINTTYEFFSTLDNYNKNVDSILKHTYFLNNFIDKDIYKSIGCAWFFRGYSKRDLKKKAIQFHSSSKYKYNSSILNYARKFKNIGGDVILLTASIDILAEEFKPSFFDGFVSSSLNKKGNIWILNDIKGKKLEKIEEKINLYDSITIIDDLIGAEKSEEVENIKYLHPSQINEDI